MLLVLLRSGKGKKRSGAGLLPFQAELGWMVAALVGLSLQQYMVRNSQSLLSFGHL